MIYAWNISEIKPSAAISSAATEYGPMECHKSFSLFWQHLLTTSYITRVNVKLHLPATFQWPRHKQGKPTASGDANIECHTHKADTCPQYSHTVPANSSQKSRQERTHTMNTHSHGSSSGIATWGSIRPARYNGVVWMGPNNGALWHLNRARWWVSQEPEWTASASYALALLGLTICISVPPVRWTKISVISMETATH